MTDALLILNCGSSSIKFAVYDATALEPVVRGQIEDIGEEPRVRLKQGAISGLPDLPFGADATHEALIGWMLEQLDGRLDGIRFCGAGHRVVHGGSRFDGATALDTATIDYLAMLRDLAPNHQPHNLAGICAVRENWPNLPQSASFDTAFHRSQSGLAQQFALPRRLTGDGIVRYGFHGLSYGYIASVLAMDHPETSKGKVVVAHLGHGASLCVMENGKSVATTMGFTALDGLVMGKRCGALDPGAVLYMMARYDLTVAEMSNVLRKQSGLLGVSGKTSDMRDLLALDSAEAREAIELFVYRCRQKIGEMAASAGGIDGLVFTAGIGENAPEIRKRICAGLDWMGIRIDAAANATSERLIGDADARVPVLVIKTNEELVIARDAAKLIGVVT